MSSPQQREAAARRRQLAAEHLRKLLSERDTYRRRWAAGDGKTPPGGINQAAVAQVIAAHLRHTGEARADHRALKDRIHRALSGRALTAETLGLIAAAFRFDAQDTAQLRELLTAPGDDMPVPARSAGPVTVVLERAQTRWLRAQLAAVHERARAQGCDEDAALALAILARLAG